MKKIQRLDFLTFDRDCLMYYTQMLAAAFTRLGLDVRIFNLCEGRTREHIQTLFSDPPDALMGVSCLSAEPIFLKLGYDMQAVQEHQPYLLCDRLAVPYFSYHIDPPLQYFHHLYSDYSWCVHIDEMACELLKQVSVKRVCFMPYGADPNLQGDRDRPYDVVCLANCYDYEAIAAVWRHKYSLKICSFMHEVAQAALQHQHEPLMQIFCKNISAFDMDLRGENFAQIYCHVENYVRGKERVELLRQTEGMDVHLFGSHVLVDNVCTTKGWKEYLRDCPWIHHHDPLSYDDTLRVMGKAKILLNSSPQFRGGGHDRVMNSMALGCVCVTNDNPFMRRHFNDDELVLFQYGEWQGLQERLRRILARPPELERMSEKGRQKILRQHTWDKRAQDFLQNIPAL